MGFEKYSQEEIRLNIEMLSNKLDSLNKEKSSLNKRISSIKSQMLDWKKLDHRQLKMFEVIADTGKTAY
jgi:hypothetical protein